MQCPECQGYGDFLGCAGDKSNPTCDRCNGVGSLPEPKESKMNCSEYQVLAARTECYQHMSRHRIIGTGNPITTVNIPNRSESLTPIRVTHSIIGICGEVGEIQELFLEGRYKDTVQITLELGDLLWYISLGLNALNINMEEIYNNRTGHFESTYLDIPARMTVVAGKLCSELQRWIYYGKYEAADNQRFPKENLIVLYKQLMGLVTLVISYINTTIGQVMEANITKLKVRYPDKYSDFHAADENRDRTKEEEHVIQDGHGFGHKEQNPVLLTHIPADQMTESERAEFNKLPTIMSKPMSDVQKAAESAVPPPTKGDKLKCQYCDNMTADRIEWFKGALGKKPGTVTVPYCGKCDLKEALAWRGMTAPVHEGMDYRIHKHTT